MPGMRAVRMRALERQGVFVCVAPGGLIRGEVGKDGGVSSYVSRD